MEGGRGRELEGKERGRGERKGQGREVIVIITRSYGCVRVL